MERTTFAAVGEDALAKLRQTLHVSAKQLTQLLVDGGHTHPGSQRLLIQILNAHLDFSFPPPVIGKLTQQQETRFRVQVQPVALITRRALTAENNVEAAILGDVEHVQVIVVEPGTWRVRHADHVFASGEACDGYVPSIAGHAIGALTVDRAVVIHRVRVWLGEKHRVFERRPVGIERVCLEVQEIALGQVHGELTVEFGAQLLVLRFPQLQLNLARRFEQIDIGRPGLQGSIHSFTSNEAQ
ncbi:hypothetical protein D3C75_764230 [compost metagenome]